MMETWRETHAVPHSNTLGNFPRSLACAPFRPLAPNDPMTPRYGRWSETNLGEKSHFFRSCNSRNLALREYNVEVRGHSPTKSKPHYCSSICPMWFCACLHMVIERELSSGGFWSKLWALEIGCFFGPSWVSPQVVLQRAPDPLAFKPFLWGSFVVCSTCWVGTWVREVIKCFYASEV